MAEARHNAIEFGKVVSRDPEVHSGDLVFAGTRVPVGTLVDYLKSDHSIEEFLIDFPSVEPLADRIVPRPFARWIGSLEGTGCEYFLTRMFQPTQALFPLNNCSPVRPISRVGWVLL